MTSFTQVAEKMYGISKPRNKSEWEARFDAWKKPASDSEEAKTESAIKQVKESLSNSAWLDKHSYIIIPQGSYHNNTNVRNDSDVDLCLCLTDASFHVPANGETLDPAIANLPSVTFTYLNYREAVTKAMTDHFGKIATSVEKKAVTVHAEHPTKTSADVVCAYRANWYLPRSMWRNNSPTIRAVGTALVTATGERIYNFPEQHYLNGIAKNNNTSRRFKRVVRVLKRLRNHMQDNQIPNSVIASSLIESLVYSCNDKCFEDSSLYENVRAVLIDIYGSLTNDERCRGLVEINGIKLLFHSTQAWTTEQAIGFITQAWGYVGFQ